MPTEPTSSDGWLTRYEAAVAAWLEKDGYDERTTLFAIIREVSGRVTESQARALFRIVHDSSFDPAHQYAESAIAETDHAFLLHLNIAYMESTENVADDTSHGIVMSWIVDFRGGDLAPVSAIVTSSDKLQRIVLRHVLSEANTEETSMHEFFGLHIPDWKKDSAIARIELLRSFVAALICEAELDPRHAEKARAPMHRQSTR